MSENLPKRFSSVDEDASSDSEITDVGRAVAMQRPPMSSQEDIVLPDYPPPYGEIYPDGPKNLAVTKQYSDTSIFTLLYQEEKQNTNKNVRRPLVTTKPFDFDKEYQFQGIRGSSKSADPSASPVAEIGEKNVLSNKDDDDRGTRVRLERMEQQLTETRQTTLQTHQLQQTMSQSLQQIERRLQAQGNQPQGQSSDRSITEEQISRRVVEQLVHNEQFQRIVQAQQQVTPRAEITDHTIPCTPLSPDCRWCHCKLRCTCRCHLLDLNERWKKETESYRTKNKSCNMQLSQQESQIDTESDVDLLPDFKNNFHDMSDVSDYEVPSDMDTQVSKRKREDRQMTTLKEQDSEHAIRETHGASGGDPGQPPSDDPSSDDDSDDGHRDRKQNNKGLNESGKKTKKWVIDPDAWKNCIEQDFQNGAPRLLDEGRLPNQVLLNEACLKYQRKHPGVQKVCKSICRYIKDQSETILDVWAAYWYKKGISSYGNEVVFVVLTNGKADVREFTTYIRCIYDVSTKEENKNVKTKETEDPLSSLVEFRDLENCLKESAKPQMEKHSNLTRVTASWYQSSGFGTDHYSLQKRPCIALYVHVKGYVPLDEEPISEEIGGYRVDVREGIFVLCGGGPNEYHRNVKMGCAIRGQNEGNQIYAGTLGAFIEFENDRDLYALTSAHVLFVGEKLRNVLEKGHVYYEQNNEFVYQPVSHTVNSHFGVAVVAVYREGGNGLPGMEVAVMKVIPERYPDAGTFPDDPTYKDKGFGPEMPLEFFTGKICELNQLSDSRLVFKYGSQTSLTEGLCRVRGASVRTQVLRDRILDFPIVMHDQIEIESLLTTKFADPGDSGALVFTKDGRELHAVGIFEGKMDDVYVVTPMVPILRELSRLADRECSLKSFQSYNPHSRDTRLVADRDSDIVGKRLESINQELAANKDKINEIGQKLEEHKKEMRDESKKQKDELSEEIKNHMTSAIQNLLLSLKGPNSP